MIALSIICAPTSKSLPETGFTALFTRNTAAAVSSGLPSTPRG